MKKALWTYLLLTLTALCTSLSTAHAQATNQVGFIQGSAWSCVISAGAAATTQCKGVAPTGLRNYVTDADLVSSSANAGTIKIVTGTGSNCGTGTADLSATFNFTANTGSVPQVTFNRDLPLVPPTGAAICVTTTGASATASVSLSGFTAP